MTHLEQPEQAGPDTAGAAGSPRTRKQQLRARIRQARDDRPIGERQAFAERLAAWEPPAGARRVSCFIGVGSEPDTAPLIERLTARGIEVILPITLDDFSLDWAVYDGPDHLVDARYGLREPDGSRLGREALGTVDVAVIPALAIDPGGRRLGQGAGCYDRSLPHVGDATPILAVVYDDERLAESLPEESHDRGVDGVLP